MAQSYYQVYPGEYACYIRNPLNKLTYNTTSALSNPSNISSISTSFIMADEPGIGSIKGSASLHHAAFIDKNGFVWVIGDNTNNITGLGASLYPNATIGLTQTKVRNAKQVQTYDNGGDNLGAGVAVVTNDGKVILLGCTESGFRADGTEGNQAEPAPFTVSLPEPIIKVVAGGYIFALGQSGKVYSWGGTRQNSYWAQFSSGRGYSGSQLASLGTISFPEAIVEIVGGSDTNYAIGKSGHIYGWAYYPIYLGLNVPTQFKIFDLTSTLNLPSTPIKLINGVEGTYALLANGDLYAWGNNTQAAVGNGQEGTFPNYQAPWGAASNSIFVTTPYKVNPQGVVFTNVFASIGDAFYVYAEDSTGTLWAWGRNKGFVIWNGQGSTDSNIQATQPNKWDVLSPMKLVGFGNVISIPPDLPTADAGLDQTIQLPTSSVNLVGTNTHDSTTSVSAKWSQISGPSATISAPSSLSTSVSVPTVGTYVFQLTITDGYGKVATDQVQVIVNPAPVVPYITLYSDGTWKLN